MPAVASQWRIRNRTRDGRPASASGDPRELADALARTGDAAACSLKCVPLAAKEIRNFHFGFSKETLRPLFHDLQSLCIFNPAYRHSFCDAATWITVDFNLYRADLAAHGPVRDTRAGGEARICNDATRQTIGKLDFLLVDCQILSKTASAAQ